MAKKVRESRTWLETRAWRLAAIDPVRWWATLRTREGKAFAGIGLAALLFGTADYFTMPPPLPSYRQVVADWHPSEAWLYDRHGRLLDSARVDFAARRLGWTPLDKVSQVTRDTLVAAEDRRFYSHNGVDWLALAGATRDRMERKRSRGASTLSMQVAGFLIPDLATPGARGWLDKLRQMRAAWALERGWDKDEILEAYLNLAGFRGEAQGIGAAALGLFGKTPDALAHDDAILLAALLPEPQASAAAVAH
ncbi:MAG: penicillin-binding protein, partial [Sphingomonas bacterium]|nr:penicillin-binding protein [Sphingomonas bacterium]